MTEPSDLLHSERYRGEYEVELEQWFRRRFGWLCVVFMGWETIFAVALGVSLLVDADTPLTARALAACATVAVFLIVLYFWRSVRPRIESRREAVDEASRMIVAVGATTFIFQLAVLFTYPPAFAYPLLTLVFWHFLASLLLPWTPRESLRAILPLFAAWAGWFLATGFLTDTWRSALLEVALAPSLFLPGMTIALYRLVRHRREFRREASSRFFVSMRRELQQARKIHESLFPQPSDDGTFRFDYRYRPAHEIGGDFVHLWRDHVGVVHLTILDVTGHGLASAMTVNRLYGELERLRYEHPYLRPGSVLSLLNRYVLLTLASHRVFATAMVLRVDPREGVMVYANAGHPPLFVRSRGGAVREFDSTAPMLGAVAPQDFGVEDVSIPLESADTIIAYTDGLFEVRDRKGRKFGLAGLRTALRRQPPPPTWPEFLLTFAESYARGALDDDLLVATLTWTRRAAPLDERVVVAPSDDETSMVSL